MREDTFRRKKPSQWFKDIGGRGWLAGRMAGILLEGKRELVRISLKCDVSSKFRRQIENLKTAICQPKI